MNTLPDGVAIHGAMHPGFDSILTADALALLADVHRRFDGERQRLLAERETRQARLDAGEERLDFPAETAAIRAGAWTVPPAPADLQDRRVEITGPVDRKMVINALNADVKCFMADFEDASTPSWTNMVEGQINLRDAVHRTIAFTDPANGKSYALKDDPAVLIVRARGLHLDEAHVRVDGAPVAGAFFDFVLFLVHNHAELARRGTGPYFYLPKLETRFEARLWALVIRHCETALGIKPGTVRVTVLIETITAVFEMDEILWELRQSITGLNAGRWDYIFSYIKRQKGDPGRILPDRAQVTMTAPFMAAYAKRLIAVCHRRGAHAMGGMSAFIPVKGDEAANDAAMERVKADKTREAGLGHDGAWVAHPALAPVARAAFDAVMPGPNQLSSQGDLTEDRQALLAPCEGAITEAGLTGNADVAIRYIASWLQGRGAAPIHNLMEDAATAEISRAQLWQWRVHGAKTDDGRVIDAGRVSAVIKAASEAIKAELGANAWREGRFDEAASILETLALSDGFEEFLTLPAYEKVREA
ncbi:malate synthase A [Alkalicaulis satelles]|uniref:malate synthase n=1 Tax=Alkalicaulis satelles TaxID=2609175 RepID=A0A5M6ZA81_9PROT|nr:malate synthase A [Alkalicaulis satelles]KAA5801606.1 malate synthase A [Alkalicaulis satelles]